MSLSDPRADEIRERDRDSRERAKDWQYTDDLTARQDAEDHETTPEYEAECAASLRASIPLAYRDSAGMRQDQQTGWLSEPAVDEWERRVPDVSMPAGSNG